MLPLGSRVFVHGLFLPIEAIALADRTVLEWRLAGSVESQPVGFRSTDEMMCQTAGVRGAIADQSALKFGEAASPGYELLPLSIHRSFGHWQQHLFAAAGPHSRTAFANFQRSDRPALARAVGC